MKPLAVFLLIGGTVVVLGIIAYMTQVHPPRYGGTTVVARTQWTYDPPIYLCHMTQVFGYAPNSAGYVTPAQAGLAEWITPGPKDGPKPTEDQRVGFVEWFDPYIDLDPGKGYFVALPCDGPYTDNVSLCNAVHARNLDALALNYKAGDCRIFLTRH